MAKPIYFDPLDFRAKHKPGGSHYVVTVQVRYRWRTQLLFRVGCAVVRVGFWVMGMALQWEWRE